MQISKGTFHVATYFVILFFAGVSFVQSTVPASSHRLTTGPTSGISIPSLTHGQMVVIADNRTSILDLADRQPFPDMTFQRLRNYISLQYAACFWGLMPDSIEDEASPFNECSHAYLSATQALLLHLKTMRGDTAPLRALIDRINLQMLEKNAALVGCRFSGEAFNTADVIGPRWSEIPSHLPSLLTLLGAMAVIIGGIAGFGPLVRASSRLQQVGSQ